MAEYSTAFPQADENPLSGGGIWEGGYTSRDYLQVVSNRVRPAVVGTQGYATVARSFSNDQFVQFTIGTFTSGTVFREIAGLLRASAPPTDTTYRVTAGQLSDGTQYVQIYKYVSGAETTLNFSSTVTWSAGDVLLGMIRGTNISIFQNNTLVLSASDSEISSGRVGLAMACVSPGIVGEQEVSSFIGGDFNLSPVMFRGA